MKIKNEITYVAIISLIALDQFIKIVINNNFFYKRFHIISHFLYFEPMYNRDYSWFNSMLQLEISKYIHILVVTVLIILIYLLYGYVNNKFGTNKIINIMYVFIF
ncbi:signal peptidase II [Clostridium rectalis]|uniref:signal peptidase II n=1 Tax=Clostridium rectalis TaxID=2040295 RepID=UPI000F6410A2